MKIDREKPISLEKTLNRNFDAINNILLRVSKDVSLRKIIKLFFENLPVYFSFKHIHQSVFIILSHNHSSDINNY